MELNNAADSLSRTVAVLRRSGRDRLMESAGEDFARITAGALVVIVAVLGFLSVCNVLHRERSSPSILRRQFCNCQVVFGPHTLFSPDPARGQYTSGALVMSTPNALHGIDLHVFNPFAQ